MSGIFLLLIVFLIGCTFCPERAATLILWVVLCGAIYYTFAIRTGRCLAKGLYDFEKVDERYREGKCGHCGYDLRGTPSRCPECGRSVPEEFRAVIREQSSSDLK